MAQPVTRVRIVQGAFALAIVALLARSAQVQLVDGAEHAAAAAAQRTERVELPARRGGIYDRNGVTLALTQEVFHVGVAPNELANKARDAQAIARHLRRPASDVRRRLQRRYAYFHGPYTSVEIEPLRAMRGVHLTTELIRFYPAPELAAPILGRPPADGRPASGLERVLDSLLAGRAGSAVVLRDRAGRRYESPSRLDAFPVPGHDVVLTLDADLQEIVESALADALDRFDAMGGDAVVINPRTGEILAIASLRGRDARSAAFTDVFEPGSTAKIFAAAALVAEDLVAPEDSVWTEHGELVVGGYAIRDDHPAGWLTLRGVIQLSSNIGIAKLVQRMSPDIQYEMLRDFGFGTPTGVEFPSESPGSLKRPHEWSGTTAASVARGYEIAVTVVQLAQAYAAIANDGIMLRPALVREIHSADGAVRYRHRPEPVRRVVSPAVAAELRTMLRGVVYRGGTAETAALSSYELAGKTGTARRAGPGGYIPGSYTASFASLFPAEDPQLVLVVKLDDPKGMYARVTAAPVTREVLERLLATQSSALDATRLASSGVPDEAAPPLEVGTVPWVVDWPPPARADSVIRSTVPEVSGRSLREAVRALHRQGLHVRIEGWGTAAGTRPRAGTTVDTGTLVTVTARRAPSS
jgi:cell division protein FtsI (penicillin-binding protein 3)